MGELCDLRQAFEYFLVWCYSCDIGVIMVTTSYNETGIKGGHLGETLQTVHGRE